jgi:hypothetical protein
MGAIGCSETSVNNYQSTPRNISEELNQQQLHFISAYFGYYYDLQDLW